MDSRFKEIYADKEHRFSLGVDLLTNKYYLEIQNNYSAFDYLEYYYVDERLIKEYPDNMAILLEIIEFCKNGKNDKNLFFPLWRMKRKNFLSRVKDLFFTY